MAADPNKIAKRIREQVDLQDKESVSCAEQLALTWRFTDKPTIMFDGDEAGKRASYKAALMSLSLIHI